MKLERIICTSDQEAPLVEKMLSILTPQEVAQNLGKRAAKIRTLMGISQCDLAARIGITAPTLRKFEKHGEIPLPQFVQLLNILGLGGKIESLLAEKHPAELEAEWNANKSIPIKRPYNRKRIDTSP